ncbi:thiamine diphosphokinase [Alkalicoccus luteus]|uniref:Thiamine diphosphokinase n=1 Tax=Alkalicoccus luteus TaxID=1237094 RepID=A0A969TTL5_9BACI|nr:thiamine diphosphokinase [Alkalicoccus luteus]NJP36400.1 thiamine diphosphokinase [Alkalicoccus luteus]
MKPVIIAGGSPELSKAHLIRLVESYPGAEVIGVDRGAACAAACGIRMSRALGDFDSVTHMEKLQITQFAEIVEGHPPEKNRTDLELALDSAKGDPLIVTGAGGGRLDHTLSAVFLLEAAPEQTMIEEEHYSAQLLRPGTHKLYSRGHRYVSLIPLNHSAKEVTTTGLQYPLQREALFRSRSLSISNEWAGNGVAEVSFTEGLLIFIESDDAGYGQK